MSLRLRLVGLAGLMVLAMMILPPKVSFAETETINYSYDTMGRLIKAAYGDGTVVDYVYDNMGNALQKATTLAGSPVNTLPAPATNPGLPDGSMDVSTRPALTWTGGGDTDAGDRMVYYVYMGTSQDPPLVWSGSQASFVPGVLRSKTTYYWKVVSRDSHNAEISSPLWHFTTEYKPANVSFTAVPTYGTAPLQNVQFLDKSGSDDQPIVSWAWDFNSDGIIDSTARNPVYSFTTPGKYSVTLSVTDGYGGSGTLKKTDYVRAYEDHANITGNVTWTRSGSPYYIPRSISVIGTLTIEPGVVVKFDQGAGLLVSGVLNAVGTAADPIYFTDIRDDAAGGDDNGDEAATLPAPGWWGGIRIYGGTATLDHTIVRYSGSLRNDPNIYVGSSGASACGRLSLTNSTISYSASYGVHVECAADVPIINGNTIERNGDAGIYLNKAVSGATIEENTIRYNAGHGIYIGYSSVPGHGAAVSTNTIEDNGGYGIYVDASTEPPALSANTISGNTLGRVVTGGSVSRNVTWTKAGGPYVINNSVWVNAGATLTLEPGVIIKMNRDTLIGVFGGLVAGGTSAEPIYFTDLRDDTVGGDTNGDGSATGPAPGGWNGIVIVSGGTAILDYVVVRYGGPKIPESNNPGYYHLYANIQKRGSGSVSITNSTISDSEAYGIQIENTSDAQTISGNTIERNGDAGIYLRAAGSGVMISENTIRDNGSYGIDMYAGTLPVLSHNGISGNATGPTVVEGKISADVTWTKAGNPYVVGSIEVAANATLTLEPGVMIKFARDGGFYVSGGLQAAGTSTEPIYFTDLRDDAAGGDTNGDGPATAPTPGGWDAIYLGDAATAILDHTIVRYGGKTYGANIYRTCNYGACTGNLRVTNSLISDSAADGIYIGGSSDQTISGNRIEKNGKSGLYLWNVGTTVLAGNIITDNADGGVSYNATGGSPADSGPINIINNTITGNASIQNTGTSGIALWNFSGPTINFYNNIIWGNTLPTNGYELRVGSGATVNGYNNDFDPARMSGAFTSSDANTHADPMFVNAANHDYHLSPSSPCIDAGSSSAPSLPAADFEGDSRMIGSAVDIGADEYAAYPNTSLTGMPSNPSKMDSATFSFTSTAQNATFACSLDGAAYAPCTSPQTYTALPDGGHTFAVRSSVPAGDPEPTPAAYAWIIDTIGSNPSAVNGTSPTNMARPVWTWTTGGGSGRFRYKLDSSDLTTGATETMATSYMPALALTDGVHTLYVQERDNAGNWSASSSKAILVDLTAPEVTITGKPDSLTNLRDASFGFSASEAGSTFQCRLDEGTFAACTSPVNFSTLEDGSHTFSVKATDIVGNTTASPASFTWTIDTVPPAAPAVSGETPVKNPKPAWTWTSGGGGNGAFRYRLDSSDLSSGATETGAATFTPANALADGAHTLFVQEKDGAGNWSTSGSFTILIDTTPVLNGGAFASNGTPTWAWTSGGGGGNGTFRYKLDSGDLSSGATETTATSFTPTSALADGAHTLYLQEKNGAGNWSASASFIIRIDTTKPVSSITSPLNGAVITSPSALIQGDTSDTGTWVKKVELSFDGGKTFTALADGMFVWMYIWQPAKDGTYTIISRATDMAGNEEIPTGGITVTVSKKGDIDGNGTVSLADAILALKSLVQMPAAGVQPGSDVNGDGRIGLAEVIYILQRIGGVR